MKNKFIALLFSNDRKLLLWGIFIFVAVLIAVMTFPSVECFFMSLTGIKTKPELIKLIGWGMSGVIAIFGVMGLLQRATTLDEQNKIMRDGQRDERIKTASEHLSSEHASVRIDSFNDFYYLASIYPNLQEYIFNKLCGYLQRIIKDKNDKKDMPYGKIEYTNEEQSLLNILFINNSVFDNMCANLAEINLQNVNLQGAKLQGANLQNAELQDANLQNTELQDANLQRAKLQRANLQNAELQGANLLEANLQKAYLQNAKLQDVELQGALMDNAQLQGANMQNASISSTHLQNANLRNVNLKDAFLHYAQLQGAQLQGAQLQGANLQYAELQGANMQNAKLHGATINKETIMPDGWEDMVERNDDGKTGVLLVDNKEKVIKQL
ncbi:MAG: pentapeptide repeat-containing protein [Gammaproteobacteria bacterium WSBS_2016_MAG_OTU1]